MTKPVCRKMRSIAVAASSMTGRNCLRYTVSVTVVVRWPTSRDVQLSGVEIDLFPSEPESFTPAKAKDQYVGGVQRVIVIAGAFKEPARFLGCPPAALGLRLQRYPLQR